MRLPLVAHLFCFSYVLQWVCASYFRATLCRVSQFDLAAACGLFITAFTRCERHDDFPTLTRLALRRHTLLGGNATFTATFVLLMIHGIAVAADGGRWPQMASDGHVYLNGYGCMQICSPCMIHFMYGPCLTDVYEMQSLSTILLFVLVCVVICASPVAPARILVPDKAIAEFPSSRLSATVRSFNILRVPQTPQPSASKRSSRHFK